MIRSVVGVVAGAAVSVGYAKLYIETGQLVAGSLAAAGVLLVGAGWHLQIQKEQVTND